MTGVPRESRLACGLALASILLSLTAVLGWLFRVPWLVQPLATFSPHRVGSMIMIPAAGAALMAKCNGRRGVARSLALLSGLVPLLGLVVALLGLSLPLDEWGAHRVGGGLAPQTPPIPLPIGVLFVANAASLLLLTGRRISERTLLAAGAVSSFQVVSAGVLIVAHLAGVLEAPAAQALRAPLQPLLAALLLGIALLQRLTVRAPFVTAPPRWLSPLAAVGTATVVLVMWHALTLRDEVQVRDRSALVARSLALAIQQQYATVADGIRHSASLLSTMTSKPGDEWLASMPGLLMSTPGVQHLLWFDSTGTLLRAASNHPLPDSVIHAMRNRLPQLLAQQPAASNGDHTGRPALRSMAPSDGPARLLLWTPVPTPTMGTTVLVALADDVALVREHVNDVNQDYAVRVLDTAQQVQVLASRSLRLANEPAQRHASKVSRSDTIVQIGARRLRLIVEPRPGASTSPLPDMVLVLGLLVTVLLTVVIELQRRLWYHASTEGRSRIQTALESATDGVWELDVPEGRMYRSRALLQSLELEPLPLDGSHAAWVARIHPDDAIRLSQALGQYLQGNASVFECEYRLRAGNGTWHTIVDRGRVVERAPDGTPLRLLGISADVTERNLARAAREESERRFRAMFDTANQIQLLLDLDGTILEANQAAGELAGLSPQSLQGAVFWQLPWWSADAATAEGVQARFAKALQGDTQSFELGVTRDPTPPITVEFSLTPIVGNDGQVLQVLTEGRDLTLRKRAEESLREISTLTTMGQLAARVAHEINNPLAGIQNAFLLIRGSIPTEHPHYRFVGAIEREIIRIASVTRQLYETYRPDQLMATHASVVLAVSDAVSFLEQVNRSREVRIVTDLSRAPSMVPVPDALLRQTLYNLVQNALDASPLHGTITVSALQDGDRCVLRVADEGPGIPYAIRERIFDPFFTTKDRTVRTGGMGIGLALVRQSVLAVGGWIGAHDRPEGGTEFEVHLPMTPLETGVLR